MATFSFEEAMQPGQQAASRTFSFEDAMTPPKSGKDRFADDLRAEMQSADPFTRNLAGAGTALSNAWEGTKQFFGQGDANRIEQNKIIADEAPVGAITGNLALAAVPFGLVGNSVRGAAAVGAGLGALEPVSGDQGFGNVALGKAVSTLTGGALGGAGQVVANKVGGYFANKLASRVDEGSRNATKDAALQSGFDMGLKMPPSSVNPTMMNTLLDSFGGKAAVKQAASINNQDALQAAVRRRLGIPDNAPIDREALDAVIKQAYQDGYAPIESLGKISASPAYADALNAINRSKNDASQSFHGMASPQIEKIVDGYRVLSPNSPAVEAKDASRTLSQMFAEKEASRINALQQQGQMQTEAAKQTTLANNFTPVAGMPRVPARISNNAELAPLYADAATDFARVAGTRQSEKEVIGAAKQYVDSLKDLSTGQFDAKHAIDTIRSLRADVDTFYKSASKSSADQAETQAKKRIAQAIEKELEFNLSSMGQDGRAMLNAYRQARQRIAEASTTKSAIKGDSLDAKVWADRANKGKFLDGEFKTIGEFAARAPGAFQVPERVGGPGVSALNAALGGTLGAGSLIGGSDPATAAALAMGPVGLRYLARQASLSRPVQNQLARFYGLSRPERTINSLLQYAPVGSTVLGLNALPQ